MVFVLFIIIVGSHIESSLKLNVKEYFLRLFKKKKEINLILLNNLHIFIPPHQFERRKKIKNKLFSIYRFICFETSRFGENFTDEMSQMNKIHFVSSSARFLIGNSCRSIRRLKKNSNELFNFIIKERNATL